MPPIENFELGRCIRYQGFSVKLLQQGIGNNSVIVMAHLTNHCNQYLFVYLIPKDCPSIPKNVDIKLIIIKYNQIFSKKEKK